MCVSYIYIKGPHVRVNARQEVGGGEERAHLFGVLLERVDVHARAVLRHRLDDDSPDKFQQPLLTFVLATVLARLRSLLLALLTLPPLPLALRLVLLLPGLFLRGGRSSLERTLFRRLLRGRSSGNDRRRLGLCALEPREAHLLQDVPFVLLLQCERAVGAGVELSRRHEA